ncbi:MAG: NUDIX hydrolase [Chloroflexota bacterium]
MDGVDKMVFIVAAIIRRGDEILLVEQQGKDDPASSWALPGGRVEPGELLIDALAREVREETGIVVGAPSRLAYLAQHNNVVDPWQNLDNVVTVFVFEVDAWKGAICINDPDGVILQARFVSVADAIRKFEETLSYRVMREPIVAYLRGEAKSGAMWFYRRQADGSDALIARLNTEY